MGQKAWERIMEELRATGGERGREIRESRNWHTFLLRDGGRFEWGRNNTVKTQGHKEQRETGEEERKIFLHLPHEQNWQASSPAAALLAAAVDDGWAGSWGIPAGRRLGCSICR